MLFLLDYRMKEPNGPRYSARILESRLQHNHPLQPIGDDHRRTKTRESNMNIILFLDRPLHYVLKAFLFTHKNMGTKNADSPSKNTLQVLTNIFLKSCRSVTVSQPAIKIYTNTSEANLILHKQFIVATAIHALCHTDSCLE